MIKRPLLWVLAVWILGEVAAARLGYSLTPKTGLDVLVREHGQIAAEAEGKVAGLQENDYGLSLVLDDVVVQIPGSVRFGSEEDILPDRSDKRIKAGCRIGVTCDDMVLHIGNRVLVEGKLSEIEEASNPGQFDRRLWYRSKGIGFSMRADEVSVTDDRKAPVSDAIRLIRKKLSENLARVSFGDDYGIFCAVLLGDKTGLSEEEGSLFRRGGAAHILAVSGMHVSILGAGLLWLLRKGPVRTWIPPLCAAVFMMAFVVLAGTSPSAIRAVAMFTAMMAARLTGKSYDPLSAAALAALVMLFMYPELLVQAGFQLSFASAFSIHVLAAEADSWVKPEGWIPKAFLASVCVAMGVMPLLAWHYYQVPVTGVFVNLAASLLTSLLLASACAAALLPFVSEAAGVFFAGTGHYVRVILEGICRINDRLPGSVLTTGRPALWLAAALEIFVLCFALWMKRQNRAELFIRHPDAGMEKKSCTKYDGCLAGMHGMAGGKEGRSGRRMLLVAGAYCLMLLALRPPPAKALGIASLDIGQGDCTVVRADGDVWMIDAGSSSIDGIWAYRIKPYLLYEGIKKVNVVALTHPDNDHINAVYDMLADESIDVGRLLVPEASYADPAWDALKAAAAKRGTPVAVAAAGEEFRAGRGMFRCLYPEAARSDEDKNALSMVLELSFGSFRGLFMGDLGEEDEPEVLARLPDSKEGLPGTGDSQNGSPPSTDARGNTSGHITFLKAGHHGSKYSSSEAFVKKLLPVFASISCGKNNRYGHPSNEVLSRFGEAGTIYRVTAWSGAVLLEMKGEAITFRAYLDK